MYLLLLADLKKQYLYDAKDGTLLDSVELTSRLTSFSFSHDGKYLATGNGGTGEVVIYDVSKRNFKHVINTIKVQGMTGCVNFYNYQNRMLLTYKIGNVLKIVDANKDFIYFLNNYDF